MNNTTTLTRAQRQLDAFMLDALQKQHREPIESLALSPTDYRNVWETVFNTKTKPFKTEVKELQEGDRVDALKLSYTAHNNRYYLEILKQPGEFRKNAA